MKVLNKGDHFIVQSFSKDSRVVFSFSNNKEYQRVIFYGLRNYLKNANEIYISNYKLQKIEMTNNGFVIELRHILEGT